MNVLELRVRLGLTRDEFASLVGCHHATVWRWEERGIEPEGGSLTILKSFDAASRTEAGRSLLVRSAKDGVGLADVLQDLFSVWSIDRTAAADA